MWIGVVLGAVMGWTVSQRMFITSCVVAGVIIGFLTLVLLFTDTRP